MNKNKNKKSFSKLFKHRTIAQKKLILSLSITSVVMIVEFVGGFITGSVALISDAGHMFTHSFAIGISLIAIIIARKPPCHHRTFGLFRAEILAAFINGLFLLFIVGLIIYEAITRIINPVEIAAAQMLIIALIGLSVNIASIIILHGGYKKNLSIRSVFYHLIGDAASSIGIVIAAVIIYYTGLNLLDPIVSLGISALILYWAIGILRESAIILLEMAPKGLNIDIVEKELKSKFPEIYKLDNTHVWTITSDILIFSAHINTKKILTQKDQERLISKIGQFLSEKYDIRECTIQLASNRK